MRKRCYCTRRWIEFTKEKTRAFSIYDCEKQILDARIDVERSVERISLGRLVKGYFIYVENQLHVRLYDLTEGKSCALYSHDKPIIAIDVWGFNESAPATTGSKSVEITMKDEPQKKLEIAPKQAEVEMIRTKDDLKQLRIMTLDSAGYVKLYKDGQVPRTMDIKA